MNESQDTDTGDIQATHDVPPDDYPMKTTPAKAAKKKPERAPRTKAPRTNVRAGAPGQPPTPPEEYVHKERVLFDVRISNRMNELAELMKFSRQSMWRMAIHHLVTVWSQTYGLEPLDIDGYAAPVTVSEPQPPAMTIDMDKSGDHLWGQLPEGVQIPPEWDFVQQELPQVEPPAPMVQNQQQYEPQYQPQLQDVSQHDAVPGTLAYQRMIVEQQQRERQQQMEQAQALQAFLEQQRQLQNQVQNQPQVEPRYEPPQTVVPMTPNDQYVRPMMVEQPQPRFDPFTGKPLAPAVPPPPPQPMFDPYTGQPLNGQMSGQLAQQAAPRPMPQMDPGMQMHTSQQRQYRSLSHEDILNAMSNAGARVQAPSLQLSPNGQDPRLMNNGE